MNVTEAIRARRSIRKYKPDPIPQAHIRLILEAAMMAPSACNCRPWEFVVITDPDLKNQLADNHPYANHLRTCPVGIVVCGRPDLQDHICPGYFPADCGAAVENILLQALELGYGTCWCGVHPRAERVEAFTRVLNLTSVPFGLITLGVPDEAPAPRGFYDESRVKYI